MIFTHNLGSFDGYFIFNYLINNFDNDQVNAIVDQHHKFISIELKFNKINFIWKDSFRIFPISLDNLCKYFNIAGKSQPYNIIFNTIDFFINNLGNTIQRITKMITIYNNEKIKSFNFKKNTNRIKL